MLIANENLEARRQPGDLPLSAFVGCPTGGGQASASPSHPRPEEVIE